MRTPAPSERRTARGNCGRASLPPRAMTPITSSRTWKSDLSLWAGPRPAQPARAPDPGPFGLCGRRSRTRRCLYSTPTFLEPSGADRRSVACAVPVGGAPGWAWDALVVTRTRRCSTRTKARYAFTTALSTGSPPFSWSFHGSDVPRISENAHLSFDASPLSRVCAA